MTEILKVTAEGEFIWHEDADRLIEEYDQDDAPAMKHILRRLRNNVIDLSAAKRIATTLGWEPKRKWSSLSNEDVVAAWKEWQDYSNDMEDFADIIQAKLKEKNA
jgi:hypothetical protein